MKAIRDEPPQDENDIIIALAAHLILNVRLAQGRGFKGPVEFCYADVEASCQLEGGSVAKYLEKACADANMIVVRKGATRASVGPIE